MKIFSTLSLFFLFTAFLPVHAQQNLLPEDDYRVYSSGTWHLGVENTLTRQDAGKNYYSNYSQLTRLMGGYIINGSFVNLEHHIWDSVTWSGQMVFDSNTDTVYMFRHAYPIKYNAGLNEEWKLIDTTGGGYVMAKVVSVAYDASLSIPDTIITIELTSYNGSNKPVNTIYSGAQIKIGKTIGLYSFPGMLTEYSPYSKTIYTLSRSEGLGLGDLRTNAEEIFDFASGDEIHLQKDIYFSFHIKNEFSIRKILDVQKSGSTIIIKDSLYTGGHEFTTKGPDSGKVVLLTPKLTYNVDTINLDDYAFLSNREKEPAKDSASDINYFIFYDHPYFEVNDRTVVTKSDNFIVDKTLSPVPPYSYYATCTAMREECYEHMFVKGLGGPYTRYVSLGGGYNQYPIYYKKGSETWGTPVSMSTILDIKPIEHASFQMYPNPANKELNISWTGEATDFQIFNIEGKEALKGKIENGHTLINTDSLAEGFYTCVVGGKAKKLVIVRLMR